MTSDGVTKALFINLSGLFNHNFELASALVSFNHINIWQVSQQLSCGDTCKNESDT